LLNFRMPKKKSRFLEQKRPRANEGDFGHRRAKVGRKVARTADVTKTDFTARSIRLGEQVASASSREITSWFTQLGSHNEYARRTGCEGIQLAFIGNESWETTNRVLQLLGRLCVEESRSVRNAAFGALRSVITNGNKESVIQLIKSSLAARLGSGLASLDRSCRLDTAALAKWLALQVQHFYVRVAIAEAGHLFLGPLASALKFAKNNYRTTLLCVAAAVLTCLPQETSLAPEDDFISNSKIQDKDFSSVTMRPFEASNTLKLYNDFICSKETDGALAIMEQVVELCQTNENDDDDEPLGCMARRLAKKNDRIGECARRARQALACRSHKNSPSLLAARIDEFGVGALDAILSAQLIRKARSSLCLRLLAQEPLGRFEAERILLAFKNEPTLILALARNQSKHRPGDHCWWLESLVSSSRLEQTIASDTVALAATAARRARPGGPSSNTILTVLPILVTLPAEANDLAALFFYLADQPIENALDLISNPQLALVVCSALALSPRPTLALNLLARLTPLVHDQNLWAQLVDAVAMLVYPENDSSLLDAVATVSSQKKLIAALAFVHDERFFCPEAASEALAADENNVGFFSKKNKDFVIPLLHRLTTNSNSVQSLLLYLHNDSTSGNRATKRTLLTTARLLREDNLRSLPDLQALASALISSYSPEEDKENRPLVLRISAFVNSSSE